MCRSRICMYRQKNVCSCQNHLPGSSLYPSNYLTYSTYLISVMSVLFSQWWTTTPGCSFTSYPSCWLLLSLSWICLWGWWWKIFTNVDSTKRKKRPKEEKRKDCAGWKKREGVRRERWPVGSLSKYFWVLLDFWQALTPLLRWPLIRGMDTVVSLCMDR